MLHADFFEQESHMDIEGWFFDGVSLLIFERPSACCDYCAYKLNTTATPLLGTNTRAIFLIAKCRESLINSMSPLLFCAIVALEEVEVGRRHVPKVDFREF